MPWALRMKISRLDKVLWPLLEKYTSWKAKNAWYLEYKLLVYWEYL